MKEPSLVVSELFGPTSSGEGPTLGQRCSFLRLGGCNLTCTWCDTPYTWDARRFDLRAETVRMSASEIVERLREMETGFTIISGGEPLLQQHYPGWNRVLAELSDAGIRIEIETNGTIAPTSFTEALVTRFMVSPKLAHSGMAEGKRIDAGVIAAFRDSGKAQFKFVCACAADVAEVVRYVKVWDLNPDDVWVMPEGTDSATLCNHLAVIADPAVTAGFNVTTRLHIHIWGNERAR